MDPTTVHTARARQGDAESLGWLFERFAPWLLTQARTRLRDGSGHAPEDVVHDVWLRTLPVLGTLQARDGRHTPVLMKFLATTLVYRVNEIHRRRLRGEAQPPEPPVESVFDPSATRSLLTEVATHEACGRVLAAVDDLPDLDRRIVVLRALEQRANAEVARDLGLSPNAVSLRFNRTLAHLRARLGPSLLDELTTE